MRAVWKFELPYPDIVRAVDLPIGAEILHVAKQGSSVCMWVLVDPNAERELRTFRIVGTGHEEVADDATYIGTVLDGSFVWHFFEERA